MTPAEFDACFDSFSVTADRLEMGPYFSIPSERERIEAFRRHAPRPVRSVRTDPWLARIALTTAVTAESRKRWRRVRVVGTSPSDGTPTEYQRYQFPGYVEAQAAGDEIRLVPWPEVAGLGAQNPWIFDYRTETAFALLLSYDHEWHFVDATRVTTTAVLDACQAAFSLAWERAVPLNEYLSGKVAKAA